MGEALDCEALITLTLDQGDGYVLVESPEIPLFVVQIDEPSDEQINRIVLPVLKEMIAGRVNGPVDLRVVKRFHGANGIEPETPAWHVLASRIPEHVE